MTPPADSVLPPAQQSLRRAVQAATKAPSVHNTQPWRFHISPEQDQGSVELFADRDRQLPVLDPTGRQLEFSCGAALLMLRVALRADGFDAAVTLLPGQDPDHLASVQVHRGADPTEQEQALAGAIALRHSQRSPFSPRAVGAQALDELRRAAQAEGAWLSVVHRRDDQLALTVLLARADREESDNAAYREELASWLRTDPAPDGIPVQVLPARGERHSEVTVRDFDLGRVAEAPQQQAGAPPVDEHPALVVLGTEGDGPAEHLLAGMALGRLLLQATTAGLAASSLGQVVDRPGPRAWLRRELNLVGDPQMVLRLGYPAAPTDAATGRRPLEEVLRHEQPNHDRATGG